MVHAQKRKLEGCRNDICDILFVAYVNSVFFIVFLLQFCNYNYHRNYPVLRFYIFGVFIFEFHDSALFIEYSSHILYVFGLRNFIIDNIFNYFNRFRIFNINFGLTGIK